MIHKLRWRRLDSIEDRIAETEEFESIQRNKNYNNVLKLY